MNTVQGSFDHSPRRQWSRPPVGGYTPLRGSPRCQLTADLTDQRSTAWAPSYVRRKVSGAWFGSPSIGKSMGIPLPRYARRNTTNNGYRVRKKKGMESCSTRTTRSEAALLKTPRRQFEATLVGGKRRPFVLAPKCQDGCGQLCCSYTTKPECLPIPAPQIPQVANCHCGRSCMLRGQHFRCIQSPISHPFPPRRETQDARRNSNSNPNCQWKLQRFRHASNGGGHLKGD